MSVFQEILFEYLRIEGKEIDTEGLIKPAEAPLHYHEAEDNFVKYYVKTKRKEPKERRPAYADGTPFPYDGYGIITAKLSLSDLKAVAKGYGAPRSRNISAGCTCIAFSKIFSKTPVPRTNSSRSSRPSICARAIRRTRCAILPCSSA